MYKRDDVRKPSKDIFIMIIKDIEKHYKYEDSEEDSTEPDREAKLKDLLFLLIAEIILVSPPSQGLSLTCWKDILSLWSVQRHLSTRLFAVSDKSSWSYQTSDPLTIFSSVS